MSFEMKVIFGFTNEQIEKVFPKNVIEYLREYEIIVDEAGSFYIGVELESDMSNPFKFSSIKTEPTVHDKVKFSGILQQMTSMNVEDQEFFKLDGFDIHDGILKLGAPSTYGIVTSGDYNRD